jgi:hypothetical protein
VSAGAEPADRGVRRAVRIAMVVALAALSLAPIGAWLDISFQRDLSYRVIDVSTAAIVALVAGVLWIIARGERQQPLETFTSRLVVLWTNYPARAAAAVGCIAALAYAFVAWSVFDTRPLLIDELVQVIQARTFVSGRLWLPLDAHPEFRSIMHMVEQNGRWYSQFPPGGPAMLAIGELVRAPWIVNPICGGVSVAAFGSALRWGGIRAGVALTATLFFAFAPFVVFQSASHMNHVTSMTWLLIATAALVRAASSDRDRPLAGFACGLALGVAAAIRPLDAAAWAVPAAAWLGLRAVRMGHWRAFLLSGVGVALPMACMFYVNAQMTGSATRFGYTVLWGSAHGLGFHESPWGEHHTVARGLALTAAYLNRLNESLFEWPALSLVPALATLSFSYRRTAIERYLMISAALVIAAYFAYWHSGFFLGPRFMYPLVPIAALLTAQLPGLVKSRWPGRGAHHAVVAGYVAATLVAIALVVPGRVASYAGGFQSMRSDYDALARRAGANGGIILVRESWGSQVIQRLWALGVSRSFTEVLYRNVDTCGLDDMATQLERSGLRGAAAESRLRPLLIDSARVVLSSLSPDGTERVLPGSSYPPSCMERIEEDRGGYTLFGPMLLTRDSATRWMRDLHARDTLVISTKDLDHTWIMRRNPSELTPTLERVNADSVRRAWRVNN